MKKLICLFLLGMSIFQAYGQITKVASVPVITERNVLDPVTGIHDYSWMLEHWDRGELYVSYSGALQVVNTKTLAVTYIPLSDNPAGMCLDKVTGKIVWINNKRYASSEVSFVVIDPANGSSGMLHK